MKNHPQKRAKPSTTKRCVANRKSCTCTGKEKAKNHGLGGKPHYDISNAQRKAAQRIAFFVQVPVFPVGSPGFNRQEQYKSRNGVI
jgi:hypothetical protein